MFIVLITLEFKDFSTIPIFTFDCINLISNLTWKVKGNLFIFSGSDRLSF